MDNHILQPVITEKSTQMAAKGVYTFEVKPYSTKNQIASLLENVYKVTVDEVKVVNRKGKVRRVGRRMTYKEMPARKIAYVTLKKGKIDLFPQS